MALAHCLIVSHTPFLAWYTSFMAQKVILNIATSLDGYVAGLDDGITWLEPYDNLAEYGFDDFIAGIGAIVMGNRSYEIGIKNGWFEGDPYGPSPIFVISSEQNHTEASGNFVFVGSIEDAYKQASAAAKDKNIYLFGGANVVQQFINQGLLDEIHLSIAPVILGAGIPLFANLEKQNIKLERTAVKSFTDGLTSLHYKIIK